MQYIIVISFIAGVPFRKMSAEFVDLCFNLVCNKTILPDVYTSTMLPACLIQDLSFSGTYTKLCPETTAVASA